MINRAELKPLLFLLYLGGSWGLYFSLLKVAVLSGVSYTGIVTLTTGGVCAGMLVIALLRRRPPGFEPRHHRYYAVAALTGYLVPILVEVFVIAHMPAGVLTLIVSVAPIATLAIAAGMRTDRVDAARVSGMLLGALAIFAILLPDAHLSAGVDWRWLLLAAIVPLAYALYHNYIAHAWPQGSDSFQLACGESIYAIAMLLPVALLTWDWQDFQAWNDGHSAILVMALIALVDVYIYFELIRIKGPIYCSHANYFMVVSGVAWGMLLFGERHSPLLWVSASLLMLSLYLVGYRKPR